VRDINTAPEIVDSNPDELVQVGTTTFFVASTPQAGRELWRSDGTEAGTALVRDVLPGPSGSDPRSLVAVNGTLFLGPAQK
jgi:ELWxxDGT repeat protein